MKDLEELTSIKMSYFFDGEIGVGENKDSNSVKELMNFFNSYSSMGDLINLDLYLNTPGGSYPDFNVLKSMIERAPFKITLINAAQCSSYGFILFYTCNTDKLLSPYCTSTIHTVSAAFEDRDERRKDNFIKTMKHTLDVCNEDFLALLKNNKVVSVTDYKKIERGEDVTLDYNQLHRIMLHCPYGNYIH